MNRRALLVHWTAFPVATEPPRAVPILLAAVAHFGITLTLPGIAGITLTIGVGIDSNVLIFERIREELRAGKTAVAAFRVLR